MFFFTAYAQKRSNLYLWYVFWKVFAWRKQNSFHFWKILNIDHCRAKVIKKTRSFYGVISSRNQFLVSKRANFQYFSKTKIVLFSSCKYFSNDISHVIFDHFNSTLLTQIILYLNFGSLSSWNFVHRNRLHNIISIEWMVEYCKICIYFLLFYIFY